MSPVDFKKRQCHCVEFKVQVSPEWFPSHGVEHYFSFYLVGLVATAIRILQYLPPLGKWQYFQIHNVHISLGRTYTQFHVSVFQQEAV